MNPYAPPRDGDGEPTQKTTRTKKKRGRYSARYEGNVLVVSRDADLPSVCMKCGTHDGIMRRSANFQWTPMWARMLVPLCALGGLIAMSITRKMATLAVPLCTSCNGKWTAGRNAIIAGVVAIVLAFVYVRTVDDPKGALGVLGIVVVAFLGLAFFFARPRMLQVDKIDDREIHLKGFHTAAGDEIIDGASG